MKTRFFTPVLLVCALAVSILLNIVLYLLFIENHRLWMLARFLSSAPSLVSLEAEFGHFTEEYKSTEAVEHTGWGRPPWNGKGKIFVFETSRGEKVFVTITSENTVDRFWISGS